MDSQRQGADFLFWGAGGHAKILEEVVRLHGNRLVALFDNNRLVQSPFDGLQVGHGLAAFHFWLEQQESLENVHALAAIGGARGKDRRQLHYLFQSTGLRTPALVHPKAHVADTAIVGESSQVLAMATVCAGARLGIATIINTKASVDHECMLDDGVHVAPGATLCGCVEVGRDSMIAAGAVVLPRIRIGANAIVGAGSLVIKDVPDSVVVYGQPATIIRKNDHA